jgi:hypothetical protein
VAVAAAQPHGDEQARVVRDGNEWLVLCHGATARVALPTRRTVSHKAAAPGAHNAAVLAHYRSLTRTSTDR